MSKEAIIKIFNMTEVYHSGEREIQNRIGEVPIADRNGAVITNTIIRGAINFIEKQPMAIVSSVDKKQNVWASILIGEHGFVEVPDANSISIDTNKVYSNKKDIFYNNVSNNSPIGTLFIELVTRRRFRINGTTSLDNKKIGVDILEAYPNCPKYIQQRVIHNPDTFENVVSIMQEGDYITNDIKDWISSSDTFFLGSQSNDGRMDASHRGGNKGFVEIVDDNTLKIPDYPGNSLYNTLGNIVQNGKSGLLFIDFENKKTLQLTGHSELMFDQTSESDLEKTGGTGRFWTFKASTWIITENQHQVNWEFTSYSPFNP